MAISNVVTATFNRPQSALRYSVTGALFLRADVMNDWRLGKQVIGNRVKVGITQIFEPVLDRFPHGAFDLALLGSGAGAQQFDWTALPRTDCAAYDILRNERAR
jgi:hypothetical protein